MAEHDDEHSEFDDDEEDEHKHKEGCGHTPEDHERIERVAKRFDKFLAENAEDMMGVEEFKKIQQKVERLLRRKNVSMTYTSLKIFQEGFQFGMAAMNNVGSQAPTILAAISKLVADREAKKAPPIDITKSIPMPPKDNETA